MARRLLHAVAIGLAAAIVCLFFAVVLARFDGPLFVAVGRFLGDWAWQIGFVFGLLDFGGGLNVDGPIV